jgi:hypothetical protein
MGARWRKSIVARNAAAIAVAILAVCGGANRGFAQDWSLSSSISQRGSYDSNLLLTPNNKVDAFGSLTIPQLKLQRVGPDSAVTLNGQFKFAEYINHSDFNSANQLLNLNANKQLSERSTLNLDADFIRDTSLTSDQDITGHFLEKSVRFITWDGAPSWTYLLSPIDKMTWTASYQNTSYDSTTETDYQYYGASMDYSHQLSELAEITGSLSYFRFDPDDRLNTATDIYGGLLGYQYSPTERLTVSGAAGLSYSETHQDDVGGNTGNSDDVGYRFKFNLDYTLSDQTTANLTLSRDTEPSNEGREVTRNRGTLTLSYQMTELTVLKLDATYADNEDYFGSNSGSENSEGLTRYWAISPSVALNFTEDLSLQASYQLRHKIFESDGGSATDNAAFLTLRYRLPEWHWSGF